MADARRRRWWGKGFLFEERSQIDANARIHMASQWTVLF
jgi:hypothetical protein